MKPVAKKQQMDRVEKAYSVDEVFNWIEASRSTKERPMPKRVDMDGHDMKVYSLRYENFMANGTKCCVCGIEGTKFYKERNFTVGGKPTADNGEYHFNLYAIDAEGDEVLMTKDHIVAKALGGADNVSNMQPMCTVCNNSKGSMTVEQWTHYQKTGEYAEDYQPSGIIPADPNSKTSMRKAKKNNNPETTKELADRTGQGVYICKSLNDRIFVARDDAHASRKFAGHSDVERYIP
jgi:hypothetical protein